MKSFKRIIAFFLLILSVGIFITVVSVKKTLQKQVPQETVKVTKDSLKQSYRTLKTV